MQPDRQRWTWNVARTSRAALALAVLLIVPGCGGVGAPAPVRVIATSATSHPEEIVVIEELTDELVVGTGVFVECDDAVAEFLLTVTIIAEPGLNGATFRVPFCRAATGDASRFRSSTVLSACGGDGGMTASVGIYDASESKMEISIGLNWSGSAGSGRMDERVTIPFDRPGSKQLAPNRHIQWQFQPVTDC